MGRAARSDIDTGDFIADEHVSEAVTGSIDREIGDDVSIYVGGDPAPVLIPHTWPFDDEEAHRLDLTPSQRSKLVRAEFTRRLPGHLTVQERHDAWHRFQMSHPNVWPACHGALANRFEEARFFNDSVEPNSTPGPGID